MPGRPFTVYACLLAVALAALGNGIYIVVQFRNKLGAISAGGYLVLLGALLGVLTVAAWFGGGRSAGVTQDDGTEGGQGSTDRVLIALVLLGAYALLFDFLGYLLATAFFLILYLKVFGSYRWLPVLAGAIVAAVGSAYLWSVVGLTLPEGIFPWP